PNESCPDLLECRGRFPCGLHDCWNTRLPVGQATGLVVPVENPWLYMAVDDACHQMIPRSIRRERQQTQPADMLSPGAAQVLVRDGARCLPRVGRIEHGVEDPAAREFIAV